MHWAVVFHLLGLLLIIFSHTQLPPIAVSLLAADGNVWPFLQAYVLTLLAGLLLWLLTRKSTRELRHREGFWIVVLFWVVLASFGALPLVLGGTPSLNFTDAMFESMSGLTTTGATVLSGIDDLPMSVRYYRQQLQWFGGMGIVVLAVAVMPMLGIGGMQLYKAETPGPMKDSKLTPRIAETAKALWMAYVGLTVACAISYRLAGMSWFDAITHSFSTVATGGSSTHDASLGYFQSPAVEWVATLFMLLAGINFALHFSALSRGKLYLYLRDPEATTYFMIAAVVSLVVWVVLSRANVDSNPWDELRHATFQVVSMMTTTGFTTEDFSLWPTFVPVLLVMMSAIGGSAGSTAGGIKVVRVLLLYKQGKREIAKLIHPRAVIPIKLGGRPVSEHVISAIWGFFALYMLSYILLSLAVTATGVDLVTAFSAVTASLNNLGPGLGRVASNYESLNTAAKWLLIFAMLLGRLELFTLLVLFSRDFWRS